MKKRILALVLSIVMTLSLMTPTAFAASKAQLTATGMGADNKLKAGDTITVTATIPAIENITSGNIQINFNKTYLIVQSISGPSTFSGYGTTMTDVTSANNVGSFSISVGNGATSAFNMTEALVFSGELKVRDDAPSGAISDLVSIDSDEYYFYGADSSTEVQVPFDKASISATILKAPISDVSKITAKVDAPQKGTALDTSVDLGSAMAYTGAVEWYKGDTAIGTAVTGPAAANQVYTAKITLTAKTADGESFDASLNGKDTAEGYKIKSVSASKLELTKTFKATASKDTPTITADPTASAITYGQKLSDSNLTGGAATFSGTSVEGKFTWKDGNTAPQVKNSNSTEYEVVFTPTDTANYAPATCKVKLEVEPKSITINATDINDISDQVWSADGVKPAISFKADTAAAAMVNTDYEVTYSNNTSVGTGKATVSPKAGGNYTFTDVNKTFNIKKATADQALRDKLKATHKPYTGIYDGSEHDAFTVTGLPAGWSAQYKGPEASSFSSTMLKVKNVADTKMYYVKFSHANYEDVGGKGDKDDPYITYKVEVKAKNLSDITVEDIADQEYTGSPIKPAPTVKDGTTKTLVKDTDYTVAYEKNTDAGTATAKITGKGNYTGTVEKEFTIAKKEVSISTASVENKAFDNTVNIPNDTVTASLSEAGLTQGTHYTVTAATEQKYVGTGTATVTVKLTDEAYKNYTFASGAQSATKTANITVTPVITVIAATQSEISVAKGGNALDLKDYITMSAGYSAKDKLTFTQSGTMPTGTSFDANTGVVTSGSESSTTAFTVKVKCSAVNVDNAGADEYAVSNELTFHIKVVDKQDANVTITGTAPTQVAYGGNGFTLSAKATDMGTGTGKWTWSSSNDAVLKVDNNGKVTIAGVGTAKITAQYESNTTIGRATTADIEVTPRGIADAKVTVTGTYIYTGSEIKPDASKVTVKIGEKTLSEGTDFTIEYVYNTDASAKAQVKIVGKGNYQGNAFATFTIDPKPLAADMFQNIAAQTYDGTAKTPALTVTDGGKTLTEGTDYTAKYTNNTNAGTATVTITGKGNYKGTASKTFTINAKAITDTTVTANVVGASFTYNGKDITPQVTVSDGSKTLRSGTDYTVTYGGNKNAGTATVTIAGKGNYADSRTVNFTISPKQVNFTATVDGKTYDGTDTIPAANIKNITVPAGEIVKGDTVTVTGTASAVLTDGTDAGSHKAKVTLTGVSISNPNYELKKDADGNYTCIVSSVGVSPLAKTDTAVQLEGSTMTKGTEAEAETKAKAIVTAPGMTEETKKALGITDGMTDEEKVAAAKKALAGKAGQSETNSQLLKLSGTAGGALVIPYPDTVTSRFTIKITLLKADGTMGEPVVLESADKLAAGLKLTAAEGLYLLSWKAPSSGGSGSGSSSYGSGAHTFTTDLTGINLVKVDNKVVPSKYYTVSGSDVTLSAEFMSTLSNGKHTIAIENATKVARATFTVSSNDKATYQPTSKEPTQAPGEIVKVTVDSGKATVTAVYVDGVKLSGKDYVLSGKTVKLQGTYTQKLSVGYHTLQVDYSNGATATARFEIKGAVVSPKTGDASVYLYAAMALMSGTGAAYVTLRRKKEN